MPESTRRAAALLLLDTLGITIASGPMEAGTIARNTAATLFATGDDALSARMLFDGRRVSIAGAAYAAATQTDNLDCHDGYNPVKGHSGVAVGYEVAGRAGVALHATACDYHTSGAWNALGVVAVVARLRNLSAKQLRQGMGIAEYHGPRSQMMREIANPMLLHDGSGWGTLAGMTAAFLAEQGFTGAPAITIEADEVASHWEDFGLLLADGASVRQALPHLPLGACRD